MRQPEPPSWQTAAAANIIEARRKNGRLGSRKSRAGCVTCKIRRVKCDEKHPACHRCTSTGRKCDGYGEQPGRSVMTRQAGAAPGGGEMSVLVGLRESDKRAFDFFLSWTAPRLGGFFDKDFWCGYVLQLAHAEPFVLDSLLAISTLYEHPQFLTSFTSGEAIIQPVGDGMKTPALQLGESAARPLDPHHAAALKAYNRAMQDLRRRIESGKATPLLALFSCVMFITIEVLRDDLVAAVVLFTKGTELLKQFGTVRFEGPEQELFTAIALIFARLGVLAAAFGHPHPIDSPNRTGLTGQHAVFASMADARSALFALMSDSHAFIRDATIYKVSLVGDNNSSGIWKAFDDAVATLAEGGKPGTGRAIPMLGNSVQAADMARSMPTDDIAPANTDNEGGIRLAPNMSLAVFAKATLSDEENAVNLVMLGHITDSKEPGSCRKDSGRPDGDEGDDDDDNFETIPSLVGSKPYKARPAPVTELRERQKQFELRLAQWHGALPLQNTDPEAVSSLLMFYHVSSIWLTTRLATLQTVFDDYTYHFQQVVHHAEIYVDAVNTKAAAVFTFEVGAIAPLFFVATKCRVPSLRRKALQVMARAPRKECMWGATSTAQASARLIAIEEEGLGLAAPRWDGSSSDLTSPVNDSVLPAETERVQNIEILNNNDSGRYEVRVTRYRPVHGQWSKVVQDYAI
ncbi:hypothetical protein LTR36_007183 [Oleoguttula mirabilis]|uniref:Zn(2)-C6 fungal-type domain-containing protein n=1 Tax=Oleoguttula mirabilis TaxID=1507867 RepID=A0AAV9JC44_9PEZI|nr:hypothetical protein LTR36_007183 [Oleoguttula mirabilis]